MTGVKRRRLQPSSCVSAAILIICLSVITAELIFSNEITRSVVNTMKSCAVSILPSLFPFMVIAKFMSNSGCISILSNTVGRLLSKITGISAPSSGAVILGLVSGFPVGASTVTDMYEDGVLTKKEAEHALLLSHQAGPAFPIAAIGAVMWNSTLFGVLLYMSQLISMIIISRIFILNGEKGTAKCSYSSTNSISRSLTDAISSSALGCVRIVGFIVFWKSLSDMITIFAKGHDFLCCILTCILEISSGASAAGAVGGVIGAALTGFALGFGGLSALMQATYFTSQAGLGIKRMIFGKPAQGVLCSLLCSIAYYMVF